MSGCSLHTSTSCLYARCDNKFFMSRDLSFVWLRFLSLILSLPSPFHSFSPFYHLSFVRCVSVFFFASFILSICLFRCFSMCLHEGDKVFNPLHVERFRSLFSKSLGSFGVNNVRIALSLHSARGNVSQSYCIFWILFVCWRFFSLCVCLIQAMVEKASFGKTGFLILIPCALIITLC